MNDLQRAEVKKDIARMVIGDVSCEVDRVSQEIHDKQDYLAMLLADLKRRKYCLMES
jgi:hypothetical protein